MNDLTKFIDKIDLRKIQYHAQEINRLCNARNMTMIKSRKEKKKKKRTNGSR